jgi:hypothetical protein
MEKLWGQEFLSLDCWGEYHSEPQAIDSVELKKEFASWEREISAYLLLSVHYADLYVLAAQASRALEAGVGNNVRVFGRGYGRDISIQLDIINNINAISNI